MIRHILMRNVVFSQHPPAKPIKDYLTDVSAESLALLLCLSRLSLSLSLSLSLCLSFPRYARLLRCFWLVPLSHPHPTLQPSSCHRSPVGNAGGCEQNVALLALKNFPGKSIRRPLLQPQSLQRNLFTERLFCRNLRASQRHSTMGIPSDTFLATIRR